jgi:signal peptidase I
MRKFFGHAYRFSSSWTGTIIIVLLIIFFIAQAFIIPSASMQNSLLIGDFLFAKKFSYGIPTPRIPITNTPILPDWNGNGHIMEGDRPERGDIVIFLNPSNTKENFVKRCFAKSGDEVIYADDTFYLHPSEGDEYVRATYPASSVHTMMGKLWVQNPYAPKYSGIYYEDVQTSSELISRGGIVYSDDKPSPCVLMARLMQQRGSDSIGMKAIKVDELEPIPGVFFNAFYAKLVDDSYFMVGDNRDNSQDSRFFGAVPYSLIVGQPWFIYFSWDSNKVPRWERIFKTVDTLENKKFENIRY